MAPLLLRVAVLVILTIGLAVEAVSGDALPAVDGREQHADQLERRGREHLRAGEFPAAIRALEAALELRRQLDAPDRATGTQQRLCLAMQRAGRFDEASSCCHELLDRARSNGDRDLEARMLNNLGGLAWNRGEPDAALDHYQQALVLRRRQEDAFGVATTLNNLAALYRGLGEIETALLHYETALASFETLGDTRWQARVLNNIGVATFTLGEIDRALAYWLRALPLRRSIGDRSGEAVTLRGLGRAYLRLGEPAKASAFYRKALEIAEAIDDRRGEVHSRRLLGEAHLALGEPRAARATLDPALAVLRATGQKKDQADVLVLSSRARLALGRLDEAVELASEAHVLYQRSRHPLGEVDALAVLADADARRGDHEAARHRLEAALGHLAPLADRMLEPSRRATFLAANRSVQERYVQTLITLHRLDPGHDLAARALESSERARSRALLGRLAQAPVSGSTAELRERLRSARRQVIAKSRQQIRLLDREHTPEDAHLAQQALYTALSALDNARTAIRRQDARALPRPPSEIDTETIHALLDSDTVLVEIFLGSEQSLLWWLTADSLSVHELPPRAPLERLAEIVHRRIGSLQRSDGELRPALDALGRALLAPIADRLRDQRLIFVLDGALHLVPLGALTSPRSGQPLLVDHEIVITPSATVLAAQRRATTVRSEEPTLAIVADPIMDRDDPRIDDTAAGIGATAETTSRMGLDALDRLPHTRLEAQSIAELVADDHRRILIGDTARRDRVLGGDLRGHSVLHFATHGFVHPRTPELSGLILSRFDAQGSPLDGFLGAHDVATLHLDAELVVLSGCRTAHGKAIDGEGLVGLSHAFMVAGARHVVASLWQVRDRATAELMTRFYRALWVDGRTPAAALREAKLGLRGERRFRDPYFWAAFELYGDHRPTASFRPSSTE